MQHLLVSLKFLNHFPIIIMQLRYVLTVVITFFIFGISFSYQKNVVSLHSIIHTMMLMLLTRYMYWYDIVKDFWYFQFGRTALHHAAKNDHLEIVKFIHENETIDLDVQDIVSPSII